MLNRCGIEYLIQPVNIGQGIQNSRIISFQLIRRIAKRVGVDNGFVAYDQVLLRVKQLRQIHHILNP